MSPMVQDSVWAPTAPVIEHADAVWDSMVQVTPASAGSGSLRVTPVAVPGPPLDTVTVKPTEVPAVTGVASAVLVMARPGALTTMVAKSWTDPAFVADAVAVLGSVPCVAPVVGLVRWTL